VLWFDLGVLAIKNMAVKCVLKTEKCMMNSLWLEEKWCSGALVTFLVLSCLVGSGLALVALVARPNQSLPVFLMLSVTRVLRSCPDCEVVVVSHDLEWLWQFLQVVSPFLEGSNDCKHLLVPHLIVVLGFDQ
jgi:hypothetical protein